MRKQVHTPALLQMEAVECGAASLGIILWHHGKIVPLAELRRECGVSRDGSNAANVVAAARRYGLEAKGYSLSVDDLRELEPPCILFWSFNHFVVFEGFVPADGGAVTRGLDSIQLVRTEEGWRLVSFTTQYENEDLRLPER